MVRPQCNYILVLLLCSLLSCENPAKQPEISNSDSKPTTNSTRTAEQANWQKSESVNAIDGVKTTTFANTGPEGTIIVRVVQDSLDVYVVTPEIVEYEEPAVRVRFDGEQPTRQYWTRSKDYHALFARDPRGLLRKLETSKHFYLEYRPYEKVPQTLTFDVSGLELPKDLKETLEKREQRDAATRLKNHAIWEQKYNACVEKERKSILSSYESQSQTKEYCKFVTH